MIMLSGKSQVASLILNMPLPESTSTSGHPARGKSFGAHY